MRDMLIGNYQLINFPNKQLINNKQLSDNSMCPGHGKHTNRDYKGNYYLLS